MSLSATEPISRAIERTKAMLFQSPVNLSKWFVMGFACFLASLDSGKGAVQIPNIPDGGPFGSGSHSSSPAAEPFERVFRWMTDHWALAVGLGSAFFLVVLALGVALTWVAARGKFVFLDNVVNDSARIAEPWRRWAEQGNSLFWFKFKLAMAGLGVFLIALAAGLGLAWADIQSRSFGMGAVLGIGVAALLMVPAVVVLALLEWLLEDFVVPVMSLRKNSAAAAFGLVWRELVRAHLGAVAGYLGLKIVMGLMVGLGMTMITLCTCCILGLPYLSSVVYLPAGVFFRAYGLLFLEQLGREWQLIMPAPAEPWSPPEDYRRW